MIQLRYNWEKFDPFLTELQSTIHIIKKYLNYDYEL